MCILSLEDMNMNRLLPRIKGEWEAFGSLGVLLKQFSVECRKQFGVALVLLYFAV